ncbi:PIG-L family deacetylase [Marinobacter adhaerens]|nr:PIG-L family deacetylase [Marinobacter adhaerens]
MLQTLLNPEQTPLRVLCLGAHCDDIEIGCGGSLLALLEGRNDIEITWVVFASNDERREEAKAGAALFCEGAGSIDVRILDFRDGFLPTESVRLKETFETIKVSIPSPDLIFTHYRKDLHQDHRAVSDLTWNTFRNNLILEYEIPKWDGDIGQPNLFVPLAKRNGDKKIRHLQQAYRSQAEKPWFSHDLFWSLMRIRGMECNADETIAEAFYSRKMTIAV